MAGLSTIELRVVVGVVVLLVLLLAWRLLRRPTARVRAETVDVLTPGAAPAARNALLVDAPPAIPPGATIAPGWIGEAIPIAAETPAQAMPSADISAGKGDDLTRIKGLGPKIAALLRGLGITRFEQIAAWSEADIARIDPQLGAFQGRIVRDNWVEQAGYLSSGDVSGFESRFGKV